MAQRFFKGTMRSILIYPKKNNVFSATPCLSGKKNNLKRQRKYQLISI
jgi:hypothetical protein